MRSTHAGESAAASATDAFAVCPLRATGGPPRSIWAIGAWKDGLFEVQDEGSQLIAAAVEAVPGERVLDLCAGNGGKSLALAAAVGPSGIVYVHDVKAYRIRALLANARRAGVEATFGAAAAAAAVAWGP